MAGNAAQFVNCTISSPARSFGDFLWLPLEGRQIYLSWHVHNPCHTPHGLTGKSSQNMWNIKGLKPNPWRTPSLCSVWLPWELSGFLLWKWWPAPRSLVVRVPARGSAQNVNNVLLSLAFSTYELCNRLAGSMSQYNGLGWDIISNPWRNVSVWVAAGQTSIRHVQYTRAKHLHTRPVLLDQHLSLITLL